MKAAYLALSIFLFKNVNAIGQSILAVAVDSNMLLKSQYCFSWLKNGLLSTSEALIASSTLNILSL